MLRQHLEWRKKYDIKNISKYKPPEVLEKYLILDFIGYDKEGCLLKYNHFGNSDFRGIFESCKIEDWFKTLIQIFEEDIPELKRQSEKLGKIVDKVVYIANFENFSLAKATDKKVCSFIISSVIMYQDNYPETMKTSYVINAPVYFNLFFSMLKAFLPSTIIRKIKVYSDDKWRKDLLENVDAEELPAFLGGKKTDPDGNPLCLTFVRNPESVPKYYHMCENRQPFASFPDAQKITVFKRAVHEIYLEVKEEDSHLKWEFQLKYGDIKFGILYQDYRGEKTEVVPMQRLNTDECKESGLYKCETTGTYIAVFDNSYSFLRPKEIYCKITVNNLHELSEIISSDRQII